MIERSPPFDFFAFAAPVAEIVQFVVARPIKVVAQSSIAAMRREGQPADGFFLDLVELAAMLGLATFTGLALVADPAVTVLVGPAWAPASALLPWVCAAFAVTCITQLQEAYLLAIDRLDGFLRATLAETLLGVVLIGACATQGAVAASAAMALRALIGLPLRSRAALAPEGIAPARFYRALVAPIAAAAGMAALVVLWRWTMLGGLPDPLYLATAIGIGIAGYAAIVLLAMPRLGRRLLGFVR